MGNWQLAGMLTYPYYGYATSRVRYVVGAVVITFILDRVSRVLKAEPLPALLGNTSLSLYLFHPVFITVLLQLGMRNVFNVWLVAIIIAFLLVAAATYLPTLIRRRGGSESSASGSDEE